MAHNKSFIYVAVTRLQEFQNIFDEPLFSKLLGRDQSQIKIALKKTFQVQKYFRRFASLSKFRLEREEIKKMREAYYSGTHSSKVEKKMLDFIGIEEGNSRKPD